MEAVLQEPVVISDKPIKFSVTDSAIATMRDEFMKITLPRQGDKEAFDYLHKSRMTVKNSRVSVDKKRQELNEDALKWQRTVNGEAKRITAQLEPIERHLEQLELAYKAEEDRIKLAAEMAAFARLESRNASLRTIGMVFDPHGEGWHYLNQIITMEDVRDLPDDQFETVRAEVEAVYMVEQNRLAEIKRKEQEELDRIEMERVAELERVKAIQEAESARLEVIRKEQAEQQRLLDEQRADLKRQQQANEAEAQRLKDAETAEFRKKEQAKRDAELKKQAAADALRKQQEQQERERRKEARRIAAAPDKEKLEIMAKAVESADMSHVYGLPESIAIAERFKRGIADLVANLRKEAASLA